MPDADARPLARASVELPAGGTVRPMTRWGEAVMHRAGPPVTVVRRGAARGWSPTWSPRCTPRTASAWPRARSASTWRCSSSTAPTTTACVHRGVVCNPVVELPEGKDRQLDEATRAACPTPGRSSSAPAPTAPASTGHGRSRAEPVEYEGDGLLARCLQHETDHTRGTVFGDRLGDRARKKLRKQMESAAEDYPPQWPVGFEERRRPRSGAGRLRPPLLPGVSRRSRGGSDCRPGGRG